MTLHKSSYRRSGGSTQLRQRVRAEPGRQTVFGEFQAKKSRLCVQSYAGSDTVNNLTPIIENGPEARTVSEMRRTIAVRQHDAVRQHLHHLVLTTSACHVRPVLQPSVKFWVIFGARQYSICLKFPSSFSWPRNA